MSAISSVPTFQPFSNATTINNIEANLTAVGSCPPGSESEAGQQPEHLYVELTTFWYCFLALITTIGLLVSLVSNMIIIYLFSRTPMLRRNPSNIIAVNLSLSDLLYCTQWPSVIYCSITQSTWMLEINLVCQTFGFITVSTALASILTVLAMSIERAIVIIYSIHAKSRFTIRAAWLIVVLIWIVSVCSCLAPLFGKFNRFTLDPSKTSCTLDYLSSESNHKLYILALYFVYWIIPAVLITICYSLIMVTFKRSTITLSRVEDCAGKRLAASRETVASLRLARRRLLEQSKSANFLPTVAASTVSMEGDSNDSKQDHLYDSVRLNPVDGELPASTEGQKSVTPTGRTRVGNREVNLTEDGLTGCAEKRIDCGASLGTEHHRVAGGVDGCSLSGGQLDRNSIATISGQVTSASVNQQRFAASCKQQLHSRRLWTKENAIRSRTLAEICITPKSIPSDSNIARRSMQATVTGADSGQPTNSWLPKTRVQMKQVMAATVARFPSPQATSLRGFYSARGSNASTENRHRPPPLLASNSSTNLQNARSAIQFRLAKMSFYLILLWFVSWSPIATLAMLNSVLKCHRASALAVFTACTMTKLGPAFDVFIYGLSHPKIKSRFKQIIMWLFMMRRFRPRAESYGSCFPASQIGDDPRMKEVRIHRLTNMFDRISIKSATAKLASSQCKTYDNNDDPS